MKISLLRDEVGGFGDGLTAADAARYLSRLHELESNAMRLLDKAETHGRVVRH
ncbi:MAG: hypothetical protein ACJ74H_14930 [Thermoanaerobaculia bacterium]